MNYQKLEQSFPGKRLTRILNCTKLSTLTFAELVVYSCLVERVSHGKGADQKQIAKAVRMDKSTSVPGALAGLQMKKLVEKRNKRWFAVPPPHEAADWFRDCRGTSDRPWYRRFAYWWMGLPSKMTKRPMTLKQMAVYFKLLNLRDNGRQQTRSGLASLLRLDRKTVRTAITKLQEVGLLDEDLWADPPEPDQLNWFRNRPEKRQFKLSEELLARSSNEAALACDQLDRFGPMMVDAGYSERQILDFFKVVLGKLRTNAKAFFVFVAEFGDVFKAVEKDHAINKANGKYTKARNSLGLLKIEAKKRINRLSARMR